MNNCQKLVQLWYQLFKFHKSRFSGVILGSLSIFDPCLEDHIETNLRIVYSLELEVLWLHSHALGTFSEARCVIYFVTCHCYANTSHFTSSPFSCRVSVIAGFTLWYFRADYTHTDEIRAESRAAHKLAARALAACFISLARPSQTLQTTLPARNKVTCSPAWSDSKLDL